MAKGEDSAGRQSLHKELESEVGGHLDTAIRAWVVAVGTHNAPLRSLEEFLMVPPKGASHSEVYGIVESLLPFPQKAQLFRRCALGTRRDAPAFQQSLTQCMQNSSSVNRCLVGAVALSPPHSQTRIDEASPIHTPPHLCARRDPSPLWCSRRPFLPGCSASSTCFLINLLSPVLCSFNRA